MVEAGFTRAKNSINIMMKNLMDFAVGTLAFWAIGFGLMFGASATGFFGTSGFFLSDFTPGGDPWILAFWMFQVVFAATAATIVSGAMAERTKFTAYLVYSLIVSALIYPIFGSWAWGSLFHGAGWLEGLGFIDFAGSTVVHSVGGWAALAGAIALGPRIGKYTKDGGMRPILGHNIPLAALVVFAVLFFDKIRIDDPVGAISVHGVCGAWGTLAAGLFNMEGVTFSIVMVQVIGIVTCFAWTFTTTFVMFKIISKTMGLRVTPEEELEGLDFTEHGGHAYPDFNA